MAPTGARKAKRAFQREPSPIQIAQALAEAMEARKQLLEMDPSIADDARAYADTLEGITDDWALELDRCIERMHEVEGYQVAIAKRIEQLEARKARFKEQEKHWRGVAQRMLELLDVHRVERADFTASIRPAPAHAVITDQDLLPPEFVRAKVEPDKRAILKAMRDGEKVPGAELSNTPMTLYLTER